MSERFLIRLVEAVLDEIPSDRALLRVLGPSGRPDHELSRGMENGTEPEPDAAVIERALAMGRPILVRDLRTDPHFCDLGTEADGRLRSCLAWSWTRGGRPAGIVYLARSSGRPAFERRDLELLRLAMAPGLVVLEGDVSGGGQERATEDPADAEAVSPILGRDPSVRRVRAMVERVSGSEAPVFIWGESGTGKELVARTIHERGRRAEGPFVAVNCAAIPESLLESELFGHARGSFTGAVRDKAGLLEEASRGTFFLDEIGDLPFALQSKLLRVLEERTIRRIGETRSRPVDIRFISATNKDLEREVGQGRFRQDLFYRLKIIGIELPPLRDRPADIPLLLDHFLEEYARAMGRPRPFISPAALELLLRYPWPGNVRELQNEVQRCLVMADGGPLILEEFLSPRINPEGRTHTPGSHRFFEARAEFEKRFLREALVRCGYHRTRTAAEVGLTRQGLFKLLKKHRLCPAELKRSTEGGEGP